MQKTIIIVAAAAAMALLFSSCQKGTPENEPAPTDSNTGTAAVTVEDAGITKCGWVQLWADGPKFATMNLGETKVTGNTKTYAWTKSGSDTDAATKNWGSAWKVPTESEMNELCLATSSTGSTKISCSYTEKDGVYGFLYTGKTAGYTGNSLFLPVDHYGYADYGFVYYWSGTADNDKGRMLDLGYNSGTWGNFWHSQGTGSRYPVRPVLK